MREGAPASQKPSATASLVVLVVVFWLFALAAFTLLARGPFGQMYEELDVSPPALTTFFVLTPPSVFLMIFAGLILGLVYKEFVVKNKRVAMAVNIITGAAGVVYLLVLVIALFLPLVVTPQQL